MFLALLGVHKLIHLPDLAEQILVFAIMTAVLWFVARPVIDLRVRHLWISLAIGVAVFVIWIGPDSLWPGYRHFWLFENGITGHLASSLSPGAMTNPAVLALRMARAVIIVPIIEELFWRAWLMRWIIDNNFEKVPLGAYSAGAFWIVAILFASEHGPYWDVGLVCGIIYNWWMVRGKSLGDLILTHAVTNFVLSAYVIAAGKWEYWL